MEVFLQLQHPNQGRCFSRVRLHTMVSVKSLKRYIPKSIIFFFINFRLWVENI